MAQSSSTVLALAIAFTIIPFVVIVARFWVRHVKNIHYGADDWVMAAAFFTFVIGYSIPLPILATQDHLGDHTPLDAKGRPLPLGYSYAFWSRWIQSVSSIPIGLTKLSVLLMYRRIFQGTAFSVVNWTAFALSVGWTLHFFANVFPCINPVSLNSYPGQKCIDEIALFYSVAATDIALDVLILAIPIPFIWKLHMQRGQKIAVTAVFLIGVLTLVASVTRLAEFVQAGKQLAAGSKDTLYVVAPTTYWSLIEASVGMIAASLVTLWPAIRGWSPESVLRSVRSALSLRSWSSNKSQRQDAAQAENRNRSPSSSIAALNPTMGENKTMVDANRYADSIPLDVRQGIIVQKTWQSTSENV